MPSSDLPEESHAQGRPNENTTTLTTAYLVNALANLWMARKTVNESGINPPEFPGYDGLFGLYIGQIRLGKVTQVGDEIVLE